MQNTRALVGFLVVLVLCLVAAPARAESSCTAGWYYYYESGSCTGSYQKTYLEFNSTECSNTLPRQFPFDSFKLDCSASTLTLFDDRNCEAGDLNATLSTTSPCIGFDTYSYRFSISSASAVVSWLSALVLAFV